MGKTFGHKSRGLLKPILKIILVLIVLVAGFVILVIYGSGPEIPDQSETVIAEVLAEEVPELCQGKTGYANNKGIKIWYELIAPTQDASIPVSLRQLNYCPESRGVILLVMGFATDALAWPEEFISAFTDAGYQIIRFDLRGVGMSDWLEDYDSDHPYLLSDMGEDALAILDTLGIPAAHLVGVSMGGMIAQQTAIDHPEKVLSLTSIMSTGFMEDPNLEGLDYWFLSRLGGISARYMVVPDAGDPIRRAYATKSLLLGDSAATFDLKEVARKVHYNHVKRKGYNNRVGEQHAEAIRQSGSRYSALQALAVPTLVIHGTTDPFVPFAHGQKVARLVPGADSLWVQGMGHDLNHEFIGPISAKILNFIEEDPSPLQY